MLQEAKRKRDAITLKAVKKRKLGGKKSQNSSEGQVVRGDTLRWKEVSLPDRLDDAEGFFGLEEIEDVDVIKDGFGKNVFFRPRKIDDLNAAQQKDGDDKEEWAGFDDSDPQTINSAKFSDSLGNKRATVKAKKQQNGVSKASLKSEDSFQSDLQFSVLDDELDDTQADVSAWKELGLSIEMLNAISLLRFTHPTPIQESAIPPIREGNDVIGKAVTGSGKTLAFGIPIYERWMELNRKPLNEDEIQLPIALILAPTRELAHQLRNHLTDLSKGLEHQPRIATVTGGLSIFKQQRQLEDADVVIGTPGRLSEVINGSQGLIARLKQIRYLVVDEADRLLAEGHFKEVEEIIDALDRAVIEEDQPQLKDKTSIRQTLVFSATFHKGLQQKLASKSKYARTDNKNNDLLSNQQSMEYLLQKLSFRSPKPIFIDSNPTSAMAATLSESIVECPAMEKDLYLYTSLFQTSTLKTLVFTNSISSVKRLTPFLQTLSIKAIALHSSMPQKSRLRSLEKFSSQNNAATVLIATDVAARGLDIPQIDQIIHYHVPLTADTYVHRSGRTARASNVGTSILLCSPPEVVSTSRLISKIHSSIETVHPDTSLVHLLRPLVSLSAKITSATLAQSKVSSETSWLRNAAEDLGVDYDSEEFRAEEESGRRHGRKGREKREKESARTIGKVEVGRWKAELRGLLEDVAKKRRLVGYSIASRNGDGAGRRLGKFLAGGRVDVNRLLEEEKVGK